MPKERRLKTTLQLDNSTGEPRRWAVVDHQGPIIKACLGTRREGERRGARPNALNYLFFKRHVQLRHTPDRSLNLKVQRKKNQRVGQTKDGASVFPDGWHIHSGSKDWARCALSLLSLSPPRGIHIPFPISTVGHIGKDRLRTKKGERGVYWTHVCMQSTRHQFPACIPYVQPTIFHPSSMTIIVLSLVHSAPL